MILLPHTHTHPLIGDVVFVRNMDPLYCSIRFSRTKLSFNSALRVSRDNIWRRRWPGHVRILSWIEMLSFQRCCIWMRAAEKIELKYLKLRTVSNFSTLMSVLMPWALLVNSLVFSALISLPCAADTFSRRLTRSSISYFLPAIPTFILFLCHDSCKEDVRQCRGEY